MVLDNFQLKKLKNSAYAEQKAQRKPSFLTRNLMVSYRNMLI